MSFITTYSSLVNSLILYVERKDPDLISCIPVSIMLAQQRINVDAKLLYSELYLTGNLTPGNPYILKPSTWLTTLNFSIGTGQEFASNKWLEERTYEFIELASPDFSVQATPIYYANFQSNAWIVSPAPDVAYPYSICCQLMSSPLDENNQTNWITTFCPELIHFAARAEVERFLHNYTEADYNDNKYKEALQGRISENSSRKVDRVTNISMD